METKEKVKIFQRNLIIFLLLIVAFYGGHYYGKRGYEIEIKENVPSIEIKNRNNYPEEIDFDQFWQVWEMVRARHLDRPHNPEDMVDGAIKGMVNSLGDPYTSFLPADENDLVTSSLNGEYQGIGAELGMRDGQLIIVAPLDGSPAKEAGVMPGDRIVKIAGESTVGISLTEAVAKIRGDAGTTITLTLQRAQREPFDVPIERGVITISSVSWEDKGNGTAYIRVSRFGGDTNADWTSTLHEINVEMSELDAVVLDLRGNPGGYMDSAVYLASDFLDSGDVVMYQESALGDLMPYKDKRSGLFEDIPAVFVLLDGGSASASEILAAALKENKADMTTIVGETSFGKGTIQDAKDFTDGSALHITIAKWLTPEKNWVHEVGISPDVEVERTYEDFEAGRDPQLDRALELAEEI
ncbi:PDZ domain-containing protein [candidate division WWE3 bacterium]|nr:PDZ domain-containing protein [candidate division WWE3 bacterium]